MVKETPFSVPLEQIEKAKESLPHIDFKLSINRPTGDFFYDPWEIKDEFKDTIWEDILNTLPKPLGEARIIQLDHGTCYMSHSDIDDRYHLNIEGQYSFLIDIESQKMFPTIADGTWYVLDTGTKHVAANFGSITRIQLVVRHLLQRTLEKDLAKIKIIPTCVNPRFEFDDIISPWLHKMNKLSLLDNFKAHDDGVSFELSKNILEDLSLFPREKFKIIIEK